VRAPGGIHGVFQVGWALAISVPVAGKVAQLVSRPSPHLAVAIVELTGLWALLAGLAWAVRVAALTSCGGWGARIRRRAREAGRRGETRR
jgi:hypothetical protein